MGSKAPDFTLYKADGTAQSREELLRSGSVLLAVFKASCPTCQLTLPYLVRLDGGPFHIYAVSQDPPATAERFVREFNAPLQMLYDRVEDNYPMSNAFGITHVPSMYLIEQDGSISWSSIGFFKKDLLDLAERAGRPIFSGSDKVPEAKSG